MLGYLNIKKDLISLFLKHLVNLQCPNAEIKDFVKICASFHVIVVNNLYVCDIWQDLQRCKLLQSVNTAKKVPQKYCMACKKAREICLFASFC